MPHTLKNLSDNEVRYLHGLLSVDTEPIASAEEKIEALLYVRACRTALTQAEVENLADEINTAYQNVACDNPLCPVHHPENVSHGPNVA